MPSTTTSLYAQPDDLLIVQIRQHMRRRRFRRLAIRVSALVAVSSLVALLWWGLA